MKVNTLKLKDAAYPELLRHIAGPPEELHWSGAPIEKWIDLPKVAIVGSRKATGYGLDVTHQLATELARSGVVIISGLAFGIDAAAHQAALEAGGLTVAVLPTSLDKIYPAANQQLATRIIDSGGTLLSEYTSNSEIYKTNFVARNRLVSGLADILLITEAVFNSGSLHTARFALEQGKTVMTVPGNITSPSSEGCNNLIKSGAVPVTCSEDVLFILGINPTKSKVRRIFQGTSEQQLLFELITQGVYGQEELALASRLDSSAVNSALTMLEINGYIRPQGGGLWKVA